MPRDHEQGPTTAPSQGATIDLGERSPSLADPLDRLIHGGSAKAIAAAIRERPDADRDELVARVHQVRGNRFALDVEGALLREGDHDPLAAFHEGDFDLSAAESRIAMPSLEGSRAVMEMLNDVPAHKLGAILQTFDRDGLLEQFLKPLPFAHVEALADRVRRIPGSGRILSIMHPYYAGRDKSDNSLTGLLGDIPYAGKALAFGVDGLTFGFASEHDSAYRAKKEGVITEDEYVDRSNHAGVKATAVAAATMGIAGPAAGYADGVTAGLAARGTAGRMASTTLTGAAAGGAAGLGAQGASDLVDGQVSSGEQYLQSMAMGAGLGAAGGALGGAVVEAAPFMPASWQAKLAALTARFPAESDVFRQFRDAGQRHVLKVKAWKLDQMLGDGAASWQSPELAMATAGLAPDATIRITGELSDNGVTVMHAEKLPDAEVFGDSLATQPNEKGGLVREAAGQEPPRAAPSATTVDEATRRERIMELARDADHGGKVTPQSIAEAEAAFDLQQAGELAAPVSRVEKGDGHSGDYYDGGGADWDVKAPHSREVIVEGIRARARADGKSEPRIDPWRRFEGEFEVHETMTKIREQLRDREGVIVDTRNMTSPDIETLREAIVGAGIGASIRWYPP